ncbi:glycosyltransferase family 39 protein [Candidatus Woesearchaeota archaeon]|nr:glycosyltransferase family 39 protein [Candidatus Woesearchaeota archaeon]
MEKTKQFLWGIFFCALLVRLILAFLLPTFTYESYFHLRQTEYITATGLPLYQDPLSYGGRELVFLPFFHYLTAFFDLFLPLEFVAKTLPNLFLALLVLLTYFIAKELGNSTNGSLFAAGIAGFLPALFSTNAFTPHSLFLPLLFFAIYVFLKLQQGEKHAQQKKKYVYIYFLTFFLACLTSSATILLLVGFGIYFLISLAESKKLPKEEWELFIASTFFYLWIQFIFFSEVLKKEGISFIWQNIPTAILPQYFPQVSVSHGIILVSFIPLITGIFVIFRSLSSVKEPKTFLLIGLAVAAILFTFLRFLPVKLGLSVLGILLAILFANFYDGILPFLRKTKFSLTLQKITTIIFLGLLVTTVYPALSTAIHQSVPSAEEVKAFEWLNTHIEKNTTVMTLGEEGHLLTAIGKRKNVMDDQFSLRDDAEERFSDVNLVYKTQFQTQALHLLEKYNIKYVVFTPHAQQHYQLKRLSYLSPECFHLVYNHNAIKIYERKCALEKK